jgi:predicted 3-demethylubiquinone-9 3-methyltransferase (glyoxalase superfamily)
MSKVTPFLMFQGNAEEVMNYYISLIEDSEITTIRQVQQEIFRDSPNTNPIQSGQRLPNRIKKEWLRRKLRAILF